MWVYKQTDKGQLYTVGFFDPHKSWEPDSDHSCREEAARRVNYLNGGTGAAVYDWTPADTETTQPWPSRRSADGV